MKFYKEQWRKGCQRDFEDITTTIGREFLSIKVEITRKFGTLE
jgi:hypothetical protein